MRLPLVPARPENNRRLEKISHRAAGCAAQLGTMSLIGVLRLVGERHEIYASRCESPLKSHDEGRLGSG